MLTEVDKRIIAGFVTAFLLMAVTMFLSYRNMSQFRSINFEVSHTHQVLFQVEEIYSSVVEIESMRRGFLIDGDQSFEKLYSEKITEINVHLDSLQLLVAGDWEQHRRLDAITELIEEKIVFINNLHFRSVDLTLGSYDSKSLLKGKMLTDSIRAVTEKMKSSERELLDKRVALANASNSQFYRLYVLIGFIIIVIFISIIYVIRARMKERLAAEYILTTTSEEIKDLYDEALCGYHSLDGEGYIIGINNTLLRWLGYGAEEVVGKMHFSKLITEDTKELFDAEFAAFKEKGFIEGVEYYFSRKDGTSFPVILSSSAKYNEEGDYIMSRSTTFDISARKVAEEKVNFLNKELEAFSYSISHDLRTPLRSIDSYTRILAEEYVAGLDKEAKRIIDVVLKNTKRMGLLIDDLLAFSKVTRQDLIKSDFDMRRLVDTLMEELEVDVTSGSLKICNQISGEGWGDKNMIGQVWLNLLSNAMKYSAKQSIAEIELGNYVEDKNTVFFIADNGVGFSMEYSHKLFGVFQRLHSAKEYEGTGVGLALSQRIVSRHGGEIWAESAPNKGATFYFSLPHKTFAV